MSKDAPAYTTDELLCVCIARRFADGDIALQGIATSLVVAGYLLAKLTHAPNLRIASAIGQGICQDWLPLSLAYAEEMWLGKAMATAGVVTAAADLLPRLHPVEFFRPAQVDPHGNFNNIAFGQDYRAPRLRLPGTGGIPDVTVVSTNVHLYVPRHSRLTFVPELDFCSGLGHVPDRRQGAGPVYLLTDLGEFDFTDGQMRLTSTHPGVTVRRVQAKTGFPLRVAPDVRETPPPTAEELRLLREQIDPLDIRKLETLGGTARKTLLRDILAREKQARALNRNVSSANQERLCHQ